MNNKNEYINALDEIKVSDNLKRRTLYKIKEKKKVKFPYKLANAMAFVLIIFCIIFISDDTKINDVVMQETEQQQNLKLPTVDNMQNLINILKNANKKDSNRYLNSNMEGNIAADSTITNKEYSKTNTQVKGIDEGDIVKTDGKYIYYISNSKLVIAEVGDNMKIVSEINYISNNEKEFNNPIELYVNNNKLILILSYETYDEGYTNFKRTTKAIEYDITKKDKIEIYREIEIEGNYITSRMANDIMYLITNKYINTAKLEEDNIELTQQYKDSTQDETSKCIPLNDVCYIPNTNDTSYLNIIAFDINTKREATIETILGAGTNVYMSNYNIYVAGIKYQNENIIEKVMRVPLKTDTLLYKFSIEKTKISYIADTEIQGSILNQFSMDEYNGNFRIATTVNEYDSENSVNNLYVLDNELNIIGRIEGLAKGEKIYSARFMGEKAYVVTFKKTDPLFVIDLSIPTEPKVLGELKIPGYSTYLHPYDDNHIIGFGEDTIIEKDYYGRDVVKTVGIKMAIYDVTDVTSPKELYSTKVGDTGTYSEVLYNHKALLFSKEKNIIAFPISITKSENVTDRTKLAFQGAIIYELDLNDGFTLKGKIAHMEVTNGYESYDYKQEIQRIIYIGDDLYTLSPATIKRADISTMNELNKLEIKIEEDNRHMLYID